MGARNVMSTRGATAEGQSSVVVGKSCRWRDLVHNNARVLRTFDTDGVDRLEREIHSDHAAAWVLTLALPSCCFSVSVTVDRWREWG